MVKKLILVCLALFLVSFVMIEALIFHNRHGDAEPGADYLIVLGAGLLGETPGPALASRLRAALPYLQNNPGTVAVCSGGQGVGETISEAEAMKRWLIAAGVDAARIRLEDRSTTTAENLAFSKALIGDAEAERSRVVVATSEFHLFRARFIARREGFGQVQGVAAETPYRWLKLRYYLREYASVCFMFLGR
jgi:uncharacterized SAM-binding protein YcdF (DUF218 family)